MVEKKLLYALDEKDNLVSIDEVKNGLDCNCICPSCKAKLVARNNGEIREHHFAHYKNSSCATGYQTSLHLLAKELISEKKKIILPPAYCDTFYENPNKEEGYYFKEEEIEKERLLTNVDVKCEVKENGIIPDLIAESDNIKLYIEIYVTHKVDKEKSQIVKQNNVSMIEINLSKEDRLISKEELSKYLFEDSSKSYWINSPVINEKNEEQQRFKNKFIEKREEEKQTKEQELTFEREKEFARRRKIQEEEIKKGICPNCHYPFKKVWDKSTHNYFYACSKYCDFCSSLSGEHKKIIQNVLYNTPIINKSVWALQYGKCPRCWSNLKIQNGKYGPFVVCAAFPRCKAKIEKESYNVLPDSLQNELNEKIKTFKEESSKNTNENTSEEISEDMGFDMSIDEFLAKFGSDE